MSILGEGELVVAGECCVCGVPDVGGEAHESGLEAAVGQDVLCGLLAEGECGEELNEQEGPDLGMHSTAFNIACAAVGA